jgi:hypothetical protein
VPRKRERNSQRLLGCESPGQQGFWETVAEWGVVEVVIPLPGGMEIYPSHRARKWEPSCAEMAAEHSAVTVALVDLPGDA